MVASPTSPNAMIQDETQTDSYRQGWLGHQRDVLAISFESMKSYRLTPGESRLQLPWETFTVRSAVDDRPSAVPMVDCAQV